MKKEFPFTNNLNFYKLFIIFVIFSIFGCYYEMILNLIKYYISDGIIFWEIRSGVIYGPFSIIYGFGAVIMAVCLANRGLKWYKVLLYGALLGGGFEYICSFLQEKFTGTTSWNYSSQFLNINGRTTIPIMIAWGVICLIFIKFIYPFLDKMIEKIPYEVGVTCAYIVLVLLIIDMFLSFSAVLRQNLRKNDIKAYTFYGQFLDKYYPDDRIKKAYPNMKFVKDDKER